VACHPETDRAKGVSRSSQRERRETALRSPRSEGCGTFISSN